MSKKKKTEVKPTKKETTKEPTKKESPPDFVDASDAPDNIIAQLQTEIEQGYRLVETARGNIKVSFPQPHQEMQINQETTRYYGKLMKEEDILTEEELAKILTKRQIWTDEDEKEGERLTTRVQALTTDYIFTKAQKPVAEDKLKELHDKRHTAVEERRVWITEKQKYFANTLESRYREYELSLRLIFCVADENDIPLWADTEAFDADLDRGFKYEILSAALYFWNGWSPDFFDESPEQVFGEGNT